MVLRWLKNFVIAIALIIQQILTFLLIWLISTLILGFILQPKPETITNPSDFKICILQQQQPELIALKSYQQQTLCQQKLNFSDGGENFYGFKPVDDGFKLTHNGDDFNTPIIYHYHIQQNHHGNIIQPISITKGGLLAYMLAMMICFILTPIIWYIIERLYKKYRSIKANQATSSQVE